MNRPYTIGKLIPWTTDYFKKHGMDSPRLDADLLLAHVLKLSRVQLYVDWDKPLQDSELATFKTLIKARAAGEPLAYLMGEKEFFSLKFKVNPATLIPRPETEHLVEEGLAYLKNIPQPKILDLATGSGCVLLSLLKQVPKARGLGLDISGAALEVAAQNEESLGLGDRVHWQQADLREPLALDSTFDLVTANLPYVSEAEYQSLDKGIKNFEPKPALVPGPTGLEAFDWVFADLPALLKEGGLALFEIGEDQGAALLAKAKALFSKWEMDILKDLSGHDRILKICRGVLPYALPWESQAAKSQDISKSRRSIRLKDYDYAQAGVYFITICTQDRECLFGNIVEGQMLLNELGKIVAEAWSQTSELRSNIVLDEFIVMPNHLHAIVVIKDSDEEISKAKRAYGNTPLQSPSQSLGAIVRGFKSAVTTKINALRNTPGMPVWQRNYYEHIIRNEEAWEKAKEYILNNPAKWQEDKMNPGNS